MKGAFYEQHHEHDRVYPHRETSSAPRQPAQGRRRHHRARRQHQDEWRLAELDRRAELSGHRGHGRAAEGSRRQGRRPVCRRHRTPPPRRGEKGEADLPAVRRGRHDAADAGQDHADREHEAQRPHRLRAGAGLPDDARHGRDRGEHRQGQRILPHHRPQARQAAGTGRGEIPQVREPRRDHQRLHRAGQDRGHGAEEQGARRDRHGELPKRAEIRH